MDTIKIGKHELILNPLITQISPNGRELRLSGSARVGNDIWYKGAYTFGMSYTFIYLDNNELVTFEFNHENKFQKKH